MIIYGWKINLVSNPIDKASILLFSASLAIFWDEKLKFDFCKN